MSTVVSARTVSDLSEQRGTPLSIHVLLADRCNHACEHCYQVHGQKGEMTLAEIERLFDDLTKLDVLFLYLSGGEVTLRQDLPEILRAARQRRFAIVLMTNGFELSDVVLETLVDVGVWEVRISVYSHIAAEHDAVTRVSGSFDKTLANVIRLTARGVRVTLTTPLTSLSTTTEASMRALAEQHGCVSDFNVTLLANEDGDVRALEVAPTTEQLARYFAAREAPNEELVSREEKLGRASCHACAGSLTVHSNGSIRPCTHIPTELGHVDSGPGAIEALTKSDAFKLIAGLRWRDVHGCRDCELVPHCNRCHGSAALETGDLLGPQPSACVRAIASYEARHGGVTVRPAEGRETPGSEGVGPFRILSEKVLERVADRVTEADRERARHYSFVQPSRAVVEGLTGIVSPRNLVRRKRSHADA